MKDKKTFFELVEYEKYRAGRGALIRSEVEAVREYWEKREAERELEKKLEEQEIIKGKQLN
ncbi:hypothetical protein FWH30_03145 [Microgenomates group bacterium]|nr:hypothetical protein [Microgenomates group bacterium]